MLSDVLVDGRRNANVSLAYSTSLYFEKHIKHPVRDDWKALGNFELYQMITISGHSKPCRINLLTFPVTNFFLLANKPCTKAVPGGKGTKCVEITLTNGVTFEMRKMRLKLVFNVTPLSSCCFDKTLKDVEKPA